jgi:hypothetical protein
MVTRVVEMRNAYKILIAKPEGKTPLAGPRSQWEDNINMDIRKGKVRTGFVLLRTRNSSGILRTQ